MLVLTRKNGEGVTITTPSGEVIEVFIRQIKFGTTSIAIGAPREFGIRRNEIAKNLLRGRVAPSAEEGNDSPAGK